MKKKYLVKTLEFFGWTLLRQGGRHEIWTNGEHTVSVPRHKDINEFTAKGILKKVEKNAVAKK